MNYLAHIYLSQTNDALAIGNFIADVVKGKQYLHYPEDIQKGIQFHRILDDYTDRHEVFRKSKKRLTSQYGHYCGVIVDIFYDHFLAKHWSKYHDLPLIEFSSNFYKKLEAYEHLLPEKILRMMPYMISQNWLFNYQYLEGIIKVLEGLDRRTKYNSKMQKAVNELTTYYDAFEKDFFRFFKDVTLFSKNFTNSNL